MAHPIAERLFGKTVWGWVAQRKICKKQIFQEKIWSKKSYSSLGRVSQLENFEGTD
jgi:hypothetical protein